MGGCSREDERELGKAAYKAKQESKAAAARADRALHQAGREARQGELGKAAYKAKQESKAAAARADRALHQAGREARQGWNDAKHQDRKKDQPAH
jgi:hypothetical protein